MDVQQQHHSEALWWSPYTARPWSDLISVIESVHSGRLVSLSQFLGSQSKGIRLEEGESPIHIPSGSLTQGAMALIVSPKPGTMPHEFTPVFRGPSSVILDIEMPFGSRMPVSSMPRSRKRFFDEGWRHVLHLSPHVTHEGAWLRDLYVSAQYIILLLDIWPFVAK